MRLLLLLCCAALGAQADLANIGLYADFKEDPAAFAYVKACGYNTYELLDGGFGVPVEGLEAYYARQAQEVARAQKDGMFVSVLLLSNMVQRLDAPIADPLKTMFTPVDAAQMQERLDYLRRSVKAMKGADAFSFFAADPGGDPEKKSTAEDFMKMAQAVRDIVAEEAPEAEFFLNTWAVAAWEQFPSPFENEFWVKESRITREIVAKPDLLGPKMNMVFPLHNYYRSLALRTYVEAGTEPDLFPAAEEVAALRARGVRHVWGWPYFLIDEIDDGYSGGTYRQAQAELRYLHAIVGHAHRLGLDGLMGNLSSGGMLPEVLNVYAFARFCKDPSATPVPVMKDFCGLLAQPESVENLAGVLAFIENHSSWEAGLPEKYRLPPLTTPFENAEDAARALKTVQVLETPGLPFPEPGAKYLERLTQRLEVIGQGK